MRYVVFHLTTMMKSEKEVGASATEAEAVRDADNNLLLVALSTTPYNLASDFPLP